MVFYTPLVGVAVGMGEGGGALPTDGLVISQLVTSDQHGLVMLSLGYLIYVSVIKTKAYIPPERKISGVGYFCVT